jgi:hypothetical protein
MQAKDKIITSAGLTINVMTVKRLHTWEYERLWKRFDRNITGLVYNRMSANTLPVVIFATKGKPH